MTDEEDGNNNDDDDDDATTDWSRAVHTDGTKRLRDRTCTEYLPRTRYDFVRPCVDILLCVVFVGCVGWTVRAESSATSTGHHRGGSSCETGYDGQTSGYQRVDGDDVTVVSTVEETDGRTDPPATPSRLGPVQPLAPPVGTRTCTTSRYNNKIIISSKVDVPRFKS